jgi:AI-2 transport protein TqsA
MTATSQPRPLVNFAMSAIIVALTIYLLVVGQNLFLPLVIAIVFWFLINVLANVFLRVRFGGFRIPRPLCFIAAILVFFAAVSMTVQFITGSLNDLGSVARTYEANLRLQWDSLPFADTVPAGGVAQMLSEWVDISTLVTNTALTFTSLAAVV